MPGYLGSRDAEDDRRGAGSVGGELFARGSHFRGAAPAPGRRAGLRHPGPRVHASARAGRGLKRF